MALSSKPRSSRSSLPRSGGEVSSVLDGASGEVSLCTSPGGACGGVPDGTSSALGTSSVLAVEASSSLLGSVPGKSPDVPGSSGGVPSGLDRGSSSTLDSLAGASSILSLAKEGSVLGEIPSPGGEASPALVGGTSSVVPGGALEASVLDEASTAAPPAMEVAAPSAPPIVGEVEPSIEAVDVRSARSR